MPGSRQLRLASRPVGEVKAADFELVDADVPEPGDGEFTVKVTHLSLDPAMRGWMNEGRSYVPPVQIGEVMRALGLGRVVASRHPGFAEGDLVQGIFGVQEHARQRRRRGAEDRSGPRASPRPPTWARSG